jgi:hypothetical protein
LCVDSIEAFAEAMYILCCGAGVGFSVERRCVSQLPIVRSPIGWVDDIVIADSKEGWADSVKMLMTSLYAGKDVRFDYSRIRPAGARLKTMGGRASGPDPLRRCHEFIRTVMRGAIGRRLSSLECHDIMCMIADVVVSGGVRRSAMISLSDIDDEEMRTAKTGDFPEIRFMANNSAVYESKPAPTAFMREWLSLAESGTGERGIFNRPGARANAPSRRQLPDFIGTNPCVTGDTLVAVADGRNAVQIRDLVGTVYPVYAIKDGRVCIANSVKTWKTRENAQVYRVTLDDGSSFRATADHLVMLRNGTYKAVVDLQPNDSLMPFNSYKSNHYRQIASNDGCDRRQYRMIAEANGLIVNAKETAIHHKDFNSYNDSLDNLQAMPHAEHRELHASRMRGEKNAVFRIRDKAQWRRRLVESLAAEKNPRYCGYTNEQLFECACTLTRALGHRARYENDWVPFAKAQGLPLSFSRYRLSRWTNVCAMLREAAEHCGYTTDRFREVSEPRPPKAKLTTEEIRSRMLNAHERRHVTVRKSQADIWCSLRCTLGRQPLKAEWKLACQQADISTEIARASSPFRSYRELQEYATTYNHRVTNVEFCGCEDVYDMTVDVVHNFGIITSSQDDRAITSSGVFVHNCGEIILRNQQFCNLSELVTRSDDDIEVLLRKVETAVWIGAIQSCATDFPYLRPSWKRNCEAERLLGVSITGQMDNPQLLTDENLVHLKRHALKIAKRASQVLGINLAAAVTCVKPSGTVSQLAACSSGLHQRWSKFAIRRYRISSSDPLFRFARDQGIPMLPEVGQDATTATRWVLEFPERAPDTAVVKGQMSALEQLEWYRKMRRHWCEHNASCTIYVKPDEWLAVGHWVYTNWDFVNGLSFLPDDGGVYELAPYQAITEEEYNRRVAAFPRLDFSQLSRYEVDDRTEGARTFACSGDKCELR